jgi:type II secretory pathway pseudopilin PulG
VSLAGWIVLGIIALAIVAVIALELRDRRQKKAAESAWQERAGAEAVRADGAEKVADAVSDIALEQQAAIQKEQRDAATERLAHPRPGARQRVQGRWKRTDDADRTDVPAGDAGAVSDPAPSGAGSSATGNPKLRGRR